MAQNAQAAFFAVESGVVECVVAHFPRKLRADESSGKPTGKPPAQPFRIRQIITGVSHKQRKIGEDALNELIPPHQITLVCLNCARAIVWLLLYLHLCIGLVNAIRMSMFHVCAFGLAYAGSAWQRIL